ncbi:hypothetical protein Btru_076336 [Bulinus truncatus]|nr:hypothetical protein Btru_076336 [Bulinus truncatus]
MVMFLVGNIKEGDVEVGDTLKDGDVEVDDTLKDGDVEVCDIKEGDVEVCDIKEGDVGVCDIKEGDVEVGDIKEDDVEVGDIKEGDVEVGDIKEGDVESTSTLTLVNTKLTLVNTHLTLVNIHPYSSQHQPYSSQHPPYSSQHPPYSSQHPPYSSQHPPYSGQHPPYSSQHPPYSSQHPPYSSQHPPYSSQHPPYSSQHPPYSINTNLTLVDIHPYSGRHPPLLWSTSTLTLVDIHPYSGRHPPYSGRHPPLLWSTSTLTLGDIHPYSGRHPPLLWSTSTLTLVETQFTLVNTRHYIHPYYSVYFSAENEEPVTLKMSSWIKVLFLVHIFMEHTFYIEAKIGFPKDQSMDAVFPNHVFSPGGKVPDGHLRPLGWQRRPDSPVHEEAEMVTTKEFYETFIKSNRPAVFRNAVSEAPVFINWKNDSYLIEKYGDLELFVMVESLRRKEKIERKKRLMKLTMFLSDYMHEEWFITSVVPREMMEEFPLPKCIRCGTIAERLISAQLWMSSGRASSRVHSHDEHLLQCVLFGRQDFMLIDGDQKKHFEFEDNYAGSMGGHSDMNTETVNTYRYKTIGRVPWTWATLHPGDCIFIPAGYIHHVRSYGRSISLTIEFAPLNKFDDTGCTLIEEEFVPLSKAQFLLSFEKGELGLTQSKWDPESVKKLLFLLMGLADAVTVDKFTYFFQEVFGQNEGLPIARRLFDLLVSGEGESQLTVKDIQSVSVEALEQFAQIMNEISTDIEGYWEAETSNYQNEEL